MVARLWHGTVPSGKAPEYQAYLRTVGLDEYTALSGNRGAFLLERIDDDVTHFFMLSFWDSIEAVKEYAGDDVNVPRYTKIDPTFLLELEPAVQHFTVFTAK